VAGVERELSGLVLLERATLVFSHASSDDADEALFKGNLEAQLAHFASTTHLLGLFNQAKGGAGITDWRKQLRSFTKAGKSVRPA
jgi:hypothetical protein